MSRQLLSGNEAIALGAHLAGVKVAVGYPGTPSTEILESLVAGNYPDIYVQWSTNEKVALEVAIGASLSGVRALATMKHVGVNVAADPLMTVTYMGVGGGLVLVTADDPGMHSSQNEQDNRHYARFAKIPMFEPSDSQEACAFMADAFRLSESFDTPVLVRSTTRISHSKGTVDPPKAQTSAVTPGFHRDPEKLVMIPAHARKRHPIVEERLERLIQFVEDDSILNRVEMRDPSIGIVTGGIAYQYVREALPDASVFKLGLSYPLPIQRLKEFSRKVDALYVVEELDPFWENELKVAGIEVRGKDLFPMVGELSPQIIRQKILREDPSPRAPIPDLPGRPPVLCPGCPHRGVFYTLNKLNYTVTGDIGCYTLGVLPPLSAMDTTTCMGASIGHALGMEKALGDDTPPLVAVIGDSTFMHSGMTGLADVVFNRGEITTLILDNHTTAMTGHQGNPTAGYDVHLEAAPRIDFVKLAEGLGVPNVRRARPYNLAAFAETLQWADAQPGASVIVVDQPCVLLPGIDRSRSLRVTDDCTGCGQCLQLGCPALYRENPEERASVAIDANVCVQCGMCAQVCPFDAIVPRGESK